MTIFSYVFFAFFALIIGNAMTTFVYRIPRNIPMTAVKRKPSCGGCDLVLKAKDFLPLYRYVFISKFCQCGKYKIPKIYPIMEITILVILSIVYFLYNENQDLMLKKILISVAVLINIFIYSETKKAYENSLWILAFIGTVYVLFLNQDVNFTQIGINLISGLAFFRIFDKKTEKIPILDSRFALILLTISDIFCFFAIFPIFILSFIFLQNKTYVANIINGIWFLFVHIFLSKYA